MSALTLFEYGLAELREAVIALDDSEMGTASNCAPWSVRVLATHALDNQLFWAGLVTGQALASHDDVMAGVAYAGDLAAYAADVTQRALALWQSDGVLAAMHVTPLGELPGSIVINFPTIDALAHAWDITASVGRAIEFASAELPALTALVDATCTDGARDHGLIQPATEAPADATDTERLMTLAGRAIPR